MHPVIAFLWGYTGYGVTPLISLTFSVTPAFCHGVTGVTARGLDVIGSKSSRMSRTRWQHVALFFFWVATCNHACNFGRATTAAPMQKGCHF